MSLLDDIRDAVRRANAQGSLAGFALGFPRLDQAAWQHGRVRLQELGLPPVAVAAPAEVGPDVYVATQLYRDGGHTALVGDFVRARASRAEGAHLIVTHAGWEPRPLTPEIRDRTGFASQAVTELLGGSLDDRLDALMNRLSELRPARTFLFHHPDDPLAVAAAQPSLCGRCFLVHHSDATPSLGLYVPGISVIELNPAAAALARVLRLDAHLLLLTCPDPGPRREGFLAGGRLVTASSGSPWKFAGNTPCTYADAVSVVLSTTGGRHVHIGALDEATLTVIRAGLASHDIDPASFVHRDWVPSLAMALREEGCDVFLASFPTDGARTLIEAAAAGTPYLAHAARRSTGARPLALDLPGAASWTGLEDLAEVLKALMDPEVLLARSRSARDWYLRLHRPGVFADTLGNIIAGRGGVDDPDGPERDFGALANLTRRLAENALVEPGASPADGAAVEARLASALEAAAATSEEIAARTPAPGVPAVPPDPRPMIRAWRMLPAGFRRRARALIRPT
jgi:hypothetical protein